VAVCALWQPDPLPVRDEAPLLGYAHELLEGGYVQDDAHLRPMRYLWHAPGFPLLLAPLVALDLPLGALRFVGAPLLFGAVLAFYALLRRRMAPLPALGWSYGLGLYGPALALLPELHKDLLALLLVVLAMLGLEPGLRGGSRPALVGAGLALGALALTRGEYGWVLIAVVAVAAVWWVRRARLTVVGKRLLACGSVGLALCVPWLAYTQAVTGKLLYWGNSAGLSLFWMSPTAPGETGEWHPARHVMRDPALRSERPFFRRLRTLPPLEQDVLLRRRAVENARSDPLRYARNVAANVSRLLFLVPRRYGYPGWVVAGAVVSNSLLLAAVGWGAARRRRRARPLGPEAPAFGLLAVLGVAIHVPAPATPRMLVPLVPLMLWWAAVCVSGSSSDGRAGPGRSGVDAAPPELVPQPPQEGEVLARG